MTSEPICLKTQEANNLTIHEVTENHSHMPCKLAQAKYMSVMT